VLYSDYTLQSHIQFDSSVINTSMNFMGVDILGELTETEFGFTRFSEINCTSALCGQLAVGVRRGGQRVASS